MPRTRKEEVTIEPSKSSNRDPTLIKQLVPETLDRATISEQLAAQEGDLGRALGGLHIGFEGSRDYGIALRSIEQLDAAGRAASGCRRIDGANLRCPVPAAARAISREPDHSNAAPCS
ncbi:hypothetical protein QZM72_11205 [Burkholderia sp. AU45388]|nr:hypothetical protein [Burkholderia sp. AU45388]MDN7426903.1 hypothetical protein [Burkholderia sp. AU45388]